MDPTENGGGGEVGHDTASIAERALESLEQAQAPSEPAETSSPAPSETPAPQAPVVPEPSAALQFLRGQGHELHKSDGRQNWLPVGTVEKMLSRYLDSHRGTFDKEREGWTTERKTLAEQAEAARKFRRMMEGDPKALLTEIARIDPRYKTFLEPPAPPVPSEEDDPEPQPDVDLGGGRYTYSLAGIRKLREWDRRRLDRALEQRLKPYAEREKQEREREEYQRTEAQIREHSAAQIARAKKNWPKFAEYETQIVKVLQDDSAEAEKNGTMPQLSLHDAWMQVVLPVLTGNHNTVRESVMKELNGAPKSTSVAQTGPEPTRAPASRSTEEIARRALARLEGRG